MSRQRACICLWEGWLCPSQEHTGTCLLFLTSRTCFWSDLYQKKKNSDFCLQFKMQELLCYAMKLGEWCLWSWIWQKMVLFLHSELICSHRQALMSEWTSSWCRSCRVYPWDPHDSPWHRVLLIASMRSLRNFAPFFLNVFMSYFFPTLRILLTIFCFCQYLSQDINNIRANNQR